MCVELYCIIIKWYHKGNQRSAILRPLDKSQFLLKQRISIRFSSKNDQTYDPSGTEVTAIAEVAEQSLVAGKSKSILKNGQCENGTFAL